MIDYGKPDLDVALEHYGVKGMKWGKRKARVSSADIHNARSRTEHDRMRVNEAAYNLNKATSKRAPASAAAQKKAVKEYESAQLSYLKNPDRATAMRMTKGEKAAVIIGTVGFSAVGLGVPAAIGSVAGVGTRVAARKSVEKDIKRYQ